MNDQIALFDKPPSPQAVAAHFDGARSSRARDEGIRLVSLKNQAFVNLMRYHAQIVCEKRGEVHIDDMRKYAIVKGVKPESPNAWGAIFRCKGWRQTGEFRPSTLVTNHSHRSPVWRWVNPQTTGEKP